MVPVWKSRAIRAPQWELHTLNRPCETPAQANGKKRGLIRWTSQRSLSRRLSGKEYNKMAKSEGQKRFDERRNKCNPKIQEALDFLMKVAANAGPNVELPPTPEKKGEGVKFRSGRQ